ncbi:hypothetical protein [Tardiphaga sp. 841_E9_N1_2]|uniref:hypothetical protein n=1 Tax=Tardiphaga sp. 841_E9_N1_2 TaxID=3240762 RepID=UPI003F20E5EA
MTEIRLDRDVIVRIVAQVLRDDFKMLPAKANEAADDIGRRLLTSLPTPAVTGLNGARLIRQHVSIDFIEAYKSDERTSGMSARKAWDLVYKMAEHLPPVLSDDAASPSYYFPAELERKSGE